jgi:hypothetical protein
MKQTKQKWFSGEISLTQLTTRMPRTRLSWINREDKRIMNGNPGRNEAAVENGNLLRLGETRQLAIYRRGGVAWVADFRGARGELFTAGEWFALNGGRASLLRRAEPEPLPADVIERIQRLHGAQDRAPQAAPVERPGDRLARFCHGLSCTTPAGVLGPRSQRS